MFDFLTAKEDEMRERRHGLWLGLSAAPERTSENFRGMEGGFLGAVVDLVTTAGAGGGDEDFRI